MTSVNNGFDVVYNFADGHTRREHVYTENPNRDAQRIFGDGQGRPASFHYESFHYVSIGSPKQLVVNKGGTYFMDALIVPRSRVNRLKDKALRDYLLTWMDEENTDFAVKSEAGNWSTFDRNRDHAISVW